MALFCTWCKMDSLDSGKGNDYTYDMQRFKSYQAISAALSHQQNTHHVT